MHMKRQIIKKKKKNEGGKEMERGKSRGRNQCRWTATYNRSSEGTLGPVGWPQYSSILTLLFVYLLERIFYSRFIFVYMPLSIISLAIDIFLQYKKILLVIAIS